jgi:hypothetical protein
VLLPTPAGPITLQGRCDWVLVFHKWRRAHAIIISCRGGRTGYMRGSGTKCTWSTISFWIHSSELNYRSWRTYRIFPRWYWSTTLPAVKYGTNGITNIDSIGSFVRLVVPATLHQLPNLISQLRSLMMLWWLWSDTFVHNKIVNVVSDMTKWNVASINLAEL